MFSDLFKRMSAFLKKKEEVAFEKMANAFIKDIKDISHAIFAIRENMGDDYQTEDVRITPTVSFIDGKTYCYLSTQKLELDDVIHFSVYRDKDDELRITWSARRITNDVQYTVVQYLNSKTTYAVDISGSKRVCGQGSDEVRQMVIEILKASSRYLRNMQAHLLSEQHRIELMKKISG